MQIKGFKSALIVKVFSMEMLENESIDYKTISVKNWTFGLNDFVKYYDI